MEISTYPYMIMIASEWNYKDKVDFIDYDKLVKMVFAADRVISWW